MVEQKIAEESAHFLSGFRVLMAMPFSLIPVHSIFDNIIDFLHACDRACVALIYSDALSLSNIRSKMWFWPITGTAVLCVGFAVQFLARLPDVTDPRTWKPNHSIVVEDRNGKDMYFAYKKEDRVWLNKNQMPDVVKHAFIAIEDQRFWERGCVDWRALARAAMANAVQYKSQGASTITQQLVRTAHLTRGKQFSRKVKEITLACRLEASMSKEDILNDYLNWIGFGGVVAGVQQASQHFFGKDVQDISLAQAAILASITQRPTYFSPYGPHRHTQLSDSGKALLAASAHKKEVTFSKEDISMGLTGTAAIIPGRSGALMLGGRAHQVLAKMLEQGYITAEEKNLADVQLLTMQFASNVREMNAPHYVLGMLDHLEKTLPADIADDQLSVVTTIDADLQKTAEQLVEKHAQRIAKKYNAHHLAMIVADVHTRHILAYVGNVNFFGGGSGAMIDMAVVPRQPGSSFKPIVYAASMQYAGWTPSTIVWDTPLAIGGAYPRNYAGDFEGPLPMIQALNHSRNIPAIRAFTAVGEDPILRLASAIGAPTPENMRISMGKSGQPFDYNWPLAIGAAEVPLLEMVQAYATFANSGVYQPLVGIESVRDSNGISYLPETATGTQALPATIADTITSMLSESRSRPEGFWRTVTNIPDMDEAVKTGTSNVCLERTKTACKILLPRDVWTIGYTPKFIVGVWMGNVDGSPLTANADGLNAAVPLWRDMLVAAHQSSLAKDAPRTFIGARSPYYTQHPYVPPAHVPDISLPPTWIGDIGMPVIVSKKN